MSVPSLPALAVRKVTANALVTIPALLAAVHAALTATTDDASAAITAWRSTLDAGNKYVIFEPPAGSPVAGKVVFIIAGDAASAPNAGAMNVDTATNGSVYFGAWVANAGATVSRADYSNWSGAAPFTGTGQFSGYIRWCAPSALLAKIVLWQSAEYFALHADDNGRWGCWGGFGLTRMDTSNGESGMSGRAFDYGCSGGVITQNWSSAVVGTGTLLQHSGVGNNPHWFYRRPTGTVIRAMTAWGSGNISRGPMIGGAAEMLDDVGNCQPQAVVLRDFGSGVPVGTIAGTHRFFYQGPWLVSDSAVRNAGGTRVFLTFGWSVTTAGDTLALPV